MNGCPNCRSKKIFIKDNILECEDCGQEFSEDIVDG